MSEEERTVTETMAVTLNGARRDLPGGATVSDVIEHVAPHARGIAVAVNGAVVPRLAWSATVLTAGDHVEVLTAVQGG